MRELRIPRRLCWSAALAVGLMVFFPVGGAGDPRGLESLGEIDMCSRGGRWPAVYLERQLAGSVVLRLVRGADWARFTTASLPFQEPIGLTGWFYHAESIYCEAIGTLGYLGAIAIAAGGSSVASARSAPSMFRGVSLELRTDADRRRCSSRSARACTAQVDFAMILPGVYVPAGAAHGRSLGRLR
jgi:hypothetical protein